MNCPECRTYFEPRRSDQAYCSAACNKVASTRELTRARKKDFVSLLGITGSRKVDFAGLEAHAAEVITNDGRTVPANVVGDSLDPLIGSWSDAEEKEFLKRVDALERIDESLWR